MSFMFENLDVYRRPVDLADRIITTPRMPLNRAALSISTNLAEDTGRFTKADLAAGCDPTWALYPV